MGEYGLLFGGPGVADVVAFLISSLAWGMVAGALALVMASGVSRR